MDLRKERKRELPSIIKEVWYSIDWDVEEIWELDLPVENVEIGRLRWHFDVPVWPDEHGPYGATPFQVIADPIRFARDFARIENADTSFPIDLFLNQGRLMVLDGIHRLAKLHLAGAETVRVRFVPEGAVTTL